MQYKLDHVKQIKAENYEKLTEKATAAPVVLISKERSNATGYEQAISPLNILEAHSKYKEINIRRQTRSSRRQANSPVEHQQGPNILKRRVQANNVRDLLLCPIHVPMILTKPTRVIMIQVMTKCVFIRSDYSIILIFKFIYKYMRINFLDYSFLYFPYMI